MHFLYISAAQIHILVSKQSTQSWSEMKLTILVLAILGVATAASVPTSKVQSRVTKDLGDDWADFMAVIDKDAIVNIVAQYLAEDAEVQAVVKYMKTDEFKEMVIAVNSMEEFRRILVWLEAGGLNVKSLWDRVLEWLEISVIDHSRSTHRVASTRITGGVAGLWADLKDVMDFKALRAVWDDKLENSPNFVALIELMKSDEAKALYDTVKANEKWQALRAKAIVHGLDIDRALDWIKYMINW